MTYEIIYTSAPQGLTPGSFGFCTVAATEGIPPLLLQRLESLSAYRHLYPPDHPRAGSNPINFSHLILNYAGRRLHVLSRIADAGLDYSHRTNKLAHHIALEAHECVPAGPAWMLAQPGLFQTEFSGPARSLPSSRPLPVGELLPKRCTTWEQWTGDAGWAGVLARHAHENQPPAYLLFREGMDPLPLLIEAQALLPPTLRWQVTFSTYYTPLPPGVECSWRCVLSGSPEETDARQTRQALVLDLTRPLGPAPDDPWAQAARQGIAHGMEPSPVAPTVLAPALTPTSPIVVSPSAYPEALPECYALPPAPDLHIPFWEDLSNIPTPVPPSPPPPPLVPSRSWRTHTLIAAVSVPLLLTLGALGIFSALRLRNLIISPEAFTSATRPSRGLQQPNIAQNAARNTKTQPKRTTNGTDVQAQQSQHIAAANNDRTSTPTSPRQPLQDTLSSKGPEARQSVATALANNTRTSAPTSPSPVRDPAHGWELHKIPHVQEGLTSLAFLHPTDTIKDLSIFPEGTFTLATDDDSHKTDGKILLKAPAERGQAGGFGGQPHVARLQIQQSPPLLVFTWEPEAATNKELHALISHVLVYKNKTPIPIWKTCRGQQLSLRHCFDTPLIRFTKPTESDSAPPALDLKAFTPDIFDITQLCMELIGNHDIPTSSEQASDKREAQDTLTFTPSKRNGPSTASEGITWRCTINDVTFEYTLKLERYQAVNNKYVFQLQGEYLFPSLSGKRLSVSDMLNRPVERTREELGKNKNNLKIALSGLRLAKKIKDLAFQVDEKYKQQDWRQDLADALHRVESMKDHLPEREKIQRQVESIRSIGADIDEPKQQHASKQEGQKHRTEITQSELDNELENYKKGVQNLHEVLKKAWESRLRETFSGLADKTEIDLTAAAEFLWTILCSCGMVDDQSPIPEGVDVAKVCAPEVSFVISRKVDVEGKAIYLPVIEFVDKQDSR
jgi:hypothetical protein